MPDPSEILGLLVRCGQEVERLKALAAECEAAGKKAKAKEARLRAIEIAAQAKMLEDSVRPPKRF